MYQPIKKYYVSDVDLFLAAFAQKHPKSTSQQAEIDKHHRIKQLRDQPKTKPQ